MTTDVLKIEKDGMVAIPSRMRKNLGLTEGSLVIAQQDDNSIVIRPAPDMEIEIYTPERIAEFLLNNSIDAADYAQNVEEVKKMGLDPNTIPHFRPED